MTKNKEHFNKCTNLVFNLLYSKFPQEVDMAIDDLMDNADDERMSDNYLATIRFLQREGLLIYQEFYFGVFNGTVLTAKGLKILDTIVDIDQTIAQQVGQALQEQDSTLMNKVVQESINHMF